MNYSPVPRYGPNPPAARLHLSSLTLNDHVEWGRKLNLFRTELFHLFAICREGNKTRKATLAVVDTIRYLDEVRNQMDNIVCHDHNALNEAHKVYYSQNFLEPGVVPAQEGVEP